MIVIADNLNALNPRVSEALKKLDPKPIQELALQCTKAKADLIDINPGYLSKGQEDRIDFLIEAVQEVSSLGLILDSPNPRILAKGLAACKGRAILNALTLEEKKLKEVLPLAVEYQTPLVLLLLDECSMPPTTLEGKIALAIELRERAITAGLAEELLLFDPLLPHRSWPGASSQIKALIESVRLLSSGALFNKPVRTMIGLSNLCSGQSKRETFPLEETCLNLLAGAGLSHVLANVLRPEVQIWLNRIHQVI
ncbi:MAG: dihydropteroate synthase [Desulfobacca sp.]|nr:dihydropteroate synthase [Desulfobacca sp.]